MDTSRRLPARNELIAILTAIAIPIHVWALFRVLASIPKWLLRATPWELVGIISYTLMLTLIETLLVFLFVVGLIALVSRQRLGSLLIPMVAVFGVLATGLMVVFLLIPLNGLLLYAGLAFAGFLALLIASYLILRRSAKLAALITTLVDRLVPLAVLYLFFDVIAVVIVVVRNLFA